MWVITPFISRNNTLTAGDASYGSNKSACSAIADKVSAASLFRKIVVGGAY